MLAIFVISKNEGKNGILTHNSDSFSLNSVFKGCFNERDYGFDNVSIIGYSRLPSKNLI